MKLLPFDSFDIDSCASPPELAASLRLHTGAPRSFAVRRAQHEFIGHVWDDGFRIKRVGPNRASFVPEIFGRFISGPTGTRIHIEVTPGDSAMTIVAALSVSLALTVFHQGAQVLLFIGSGLLFAWLFGMIGFWLDRGAASRRLTQLLADPPPAAELHSDR